MTKKSFSWTKNTKAIVWDLDGTLYPPSEKMSDAISDAAITVIANHLNTNEEDAKSEFEKLHQKFFSTTKTLDYLGLNGVNFFVELWQNLDLKKYIKKNTELIKDFENNKSKLRQAMLTNSNSLENVEQKLDAVGLSPDFFEVIFTSTIIGRHKPDPEAFLHVCQKLELSPEEIIYVGDRERVDIQAAKRVSMRAALIIWGKTPAKLQTQADIVINKPQEIFDYFE